MTITAYWNPETQQLELTPPPPAQADWDMLSKELAEHGMMVAPIDDMRILRSIVEAANRAIEHSGEEWDVVSDLCNAFNMATWLNELKPTSDRQGENL